MGAPALGLAAPLTEQGLAWVIPELEAETGPHSFHKYLSAPKPATGARGLRKNKTHRGLPLGSLRSSQRVKSSINIKKKIRRNQDRQQVLIPKESETLAPKAGKADSVPR